MKKTLIIIGLIIAFSFILFSCGKGEESVLTAAPEPDTTEVAVSDTDVPTDTEVPTETEAPTDTEAPETVARPAADGQECLAYDLSFYLPSSLTPNEWNGMLGVYEYYTGEYSGSAPYGLDFSLVVSDESTAGGDLDSYARDASAKSAGAAVEPEKVDINGAEWLRFTVDSGHVNYYTIFNGWLYELTTSVGGDTQENYDAARAMLEETLFLAATDH